MRSLDRHQSGPSKAAPLVTTCVPVRHEGVIGRSHTDGDGIPNLLEYALGSDPRSADSAATVLAPTAGSATLTYRRRVDAPDIVYVVEASSDMIHWSPGGVSIEEVSVMPADILFDQVTVRILSSQAALFLRLRIELAAE